MTKSKNRSWIKRHVDDSYVKQAQTDGYRSRASYKLLEIVQKDRLIRSGMTVVDLGSSPGGWSQVAARFVGASGTVIALDILPMSPVAGVTFLNGDFTDETVFLELMSMAKRRTIDLVISDIAPNLTGIRAVDQPAVFYLAELALDFALKVLTFKGIFIAKLFQGQGFDSFVLDLRKRFNKVTICKPDASRPKSREVYIVANGLKANERG